jgi:Transposase DDE domain group 1
MAWCEANRADFLFGLGRNTRPDEQIRSEPMTAALESRRIGRSARCFKDFTWSTLDSWSRGRRVVGKAEVAGGVARWPDSRNCHRRCGRWLTVA